MSHEFHKEEYKGCTIRIVQDESPEDPREDYDHIGTMEPWDDTPRREGWTDEGRDNFFLVLAKRQLAIREKLTGKEYVDYEVDEDDADYTTLPDFGDSIEMALADNVILAYSHYDGSQASVCEASDWSRCAGYIYISMDVARSNWRGTDNEIRAAAEACLRAELEELNNWIQGNVAAWIAEDPDGEQIASCWGYYPDEYPKGWDYPIQCARDAIDHWAKDQHELALQECMNI